MPVNRVTQVGAVNAYLVQEDDGLTLVDTMLKGSQKKILAAADDAGAPIVRIVLTHYHDDHSGSLDALADALPDAEVMWSARETPFMRGKGEVDQKNIGKKDGWGNLPAKDRQEVLQQIGRELPAHFRETIEEYFKRLAQDGVK